jgi:hypothetical protein
MAASVASSASKRSRSDNGATLTKDDTSDNTKRLKPATSSSSGGSEGKSGVSLLVSSVSHGGTDGKEATYLRGFGGEFSSEALHDALPKIGSTPQKYQPFHHRRHLASASPNSLSASLPPLSLLTVVGVDVHMVYMLNNYLEHHSQLLVL